MSLKTTDPRIVPETTLRVAKAAFPKGSLALRLRDLLGGVYDEGTFADLFSRRGPPAEAPWRLALVTVLQFAENLTDRQAADAVRGRIDWKAALGLALEDAGFDFSVLSKFRSRLITGEAEGLLLDTLLERCKEKQLLRQRGRARTDATAVLTSVRALNRLELITETLRAALNELATVAPDWLREVARPEWFERYADRVEEAQLPKGVAARQEYAEVVGHDGFALFKALDRPISLELSRLDAVEALRQVWLQHFWLEDGKVRLRAAKDLPPSARRLQSPYDVDARYSKKADFTWVGYKVHLTESCDDDLPHLITNALTSRATLRDSEVTADVHASLAAKALLPAVHFTDAAYVDADLLTDSFGTYGVDLFSPVMGDPSWQGRTPEAYHAGMFEIDWDEHRARCPEGKTSYRWIADHDASGHATLRIKFRHEDCALCPARPRCTRSQDKPRVILIRQQRQHEALCGARERMKMSEWRATYQKRQGIEGTISEGVREHGMRRSRYVGTAKTHVQNVAIAAGINVQRLSAWVEGRPRAKTRISRFKRLQA